MSIYIVDIYVGILVTESCHVRLYIRVLARAKKSKAKAKAKANAKITESCVQNIFYLQFFIGSVWALDVPASLLASFPFFFNHFSLTVGEAAAAAQHIK